MILLVSYGRSIWVFHLWDAMNLMWMVVTKPIWEHLDIGDKKWVWGHCVVLFRPSWYWLLKMGWDFCHQRRPQNYKLLLLWQVLVGGDSRNTVLWSSGIEKKPWWLLYILKWNNSISKINVCVLLRDANGEMDK